MVDKKKTPSILIEQIRAAILDGLCKPGERYRNKLFAKSLQYEVEFYLPGKVRPSELWSMRIKASIRGENKPQHRRAQGVTGQERLIPLIDSSQSRRTRQALLSLERLDPQTGNVLFNMEQMSADEIRAPRKRWSDPD